MKSFNQFHTISQLSPLALVLSVSSDTLHQHLKILHAPLSVAEPALTIFFPYSGYIYCIVSSKTKAGNTKKKRWRKKTSFKNVNVIYAPCRYNAPYLL